MITIDGVQYRNLEEQVKKNMDDIAYILEEEGVLNEFGIKIVGEVDSSGDLPDPTTYEGEFGDAYAVGTTTPYTLYIYTRANGSHATNYWFNIGQFPLPGPAGPAGEPGEDGATGLPALEFSGRRTTSTVPIIGQSFGTSASNFNRTPVVGDYFLVIVLGLNGTSVEGRSWITNNEISSIAGSTYNFQIRSVMETTGAQGPQGNPGAAGSPGAQGPQGPIGPQGNPGQSFVIAGTVANEGQLPDPSTVADNIAYLVGTAAPYDLYVQLQDSSEWFNAGIVEGVQGPQGPQGVAGESALGFTAALTTNYEPQGNETSVYATSFFNRTPIIGDTVLAVAQGANEVEGRSWIVNLQVTSISDNMVTLKWVDTVETTGLQGPAGTQPELANTRGTDANVAISQQGIENIFYNNSISLGKNSGDERFYSNSISIGTNALATTNAIAIGADSEARNLDCISIGMNANSSITSISIGVNSDSESHGISIGENSESYGSIAIGENSNAPFYEGVSVGNNSFSGGGAVAIGVNSSSQGNFSVAIGNNSYAYGGVAIGGGANAPAYNGIAIGIDSIAAGAVGATALGTNAFAGLNSTAIGYLANASSMNCIQLGEGNNATNNTFQVGNYPLLNLTTGLIPSERLPDTTIPVANSTTLGGVMPVTKTDDMTQEVGVDSDGKLYTAPGGGGGGTVEVVQDLGTSETSVISQNGINNLLRGNNALLGNISLKSPSTTNTVLIGTNAHDYSTGSSDCIAIGTNTECGLKGGVAIGANTHIYSTSTNCVAIGKNVTIGDSIMNTIALGHDFMVRYSPNSLNALVLQNIPVLNFTTGKILPNVLPPIDMSSIRVVYNRDSQYVTSSYSSPIALTNGLISISDLSSSINGIGAVGIDTMVPAYGQYNSKQVVGIYSVSDSTGINIVFQDGTTEEMSPTRITATSTKPTYVSTQSTPMKTSMKAVITSPNIPQSHNSEENEEMSITVKT